jgi:hypothetical protein
MNYSEVEFFALIEAVEVQGGEHLDTRCTARRYDTFSGGTKVKPVMLPACGAVQGYLREPRRDGRRASDG